MENKRLKKMVTITLPPELVDRFEKWLENQEFPPNKSAVIETALSDFLDNRNG